MPNQNERKPTAFEHQPSENAFPRLSPHRPRDQSTDAVLSKLVSPTEKHDRILNGKNKPINAPDMMLLQRIADITATNVMDANSLFQLLPDTELAMQILVSSTLSPKDMNNVELTFKVDPQVFDGPISGTLLEIIDNYFTNVYKITDLLRRMLEDALFLTGAYPLLILPENSIDEVINSPNRVALEALREDFKNDGSPISLGLLGNPTKASAEPTFSFESMQKGQPVNAYDPVLRLGENNSFESRTTITDNINVLKLPMVMDKMRQDRVNDMLSKRGVGMEMFKGRVSQEGFDMPESQPSVYRNRRYKSVPVQVIPPGDRLKRKTIGHPLVMHLPTECVIPVHVPSNPEEHLGYFVLLDKNGNPIVHANISDYYNDLSANLVNNQEMVSQLINTTRRAEKGRDAFKKEDTEELTRIYTDLVERDLLDRLKNGVYGENVAVGKPQEVYRIMLARALAKQHTQVLYIPAELMTYVAFDYNQYGVGTSLIQNAKIIAGIRAMLLFANTMAAVKNSIGRTALNITLDPEDPDPSKTVEFMFHEYVKNRQGSYPLGASNPRDIVDFLQNAGVEVAVTGNTAYPDTKLEVESKQGNVTKPDQDLENTIRERYLMALGLTPETVDAGAHAEFATTVVQNNLLLSKRVMLYQKLLTAFVADFVQKYTLNSGYLLEELRQAIRENYSKLTDEQREDAKDTSLKHTAGNPIDKPSTESVEDTVETADGKGPTEQEVETLLIQFINAIRASLPTPDVATLDNQMKAFDAFVDALDKALKAYIDSAFLNDSTMGELAPVIETTVATVRAHFIRQWMRNNNVLPELDELTTMTDDGEASLDILNATELHVDALGKSIIPYMRKLIADRKARDASMSDIKGDLGATGGGSDFGGGGGSTDFGGGSDTGTTSDTGDAGDLGSFDDIPGLDDTEGGKPDEGAGSTDTTEKPDNGEEGSDQSGGEGANKDEEDDLDLDGHLRSKNAAFKPLPS